MLNNLIDSLLRFLMSLLQVRFEAPMNSIKKFHCSIIRNNSVQRFNRGIMNAIIVSLGRGDGGGGGGFRAPSAHFLNTQRVHESV